MEIVGEALVPATPARVREVLADPVRMQRVTSAHAGALTPVGPGEWDADWVLGLPPLGQRHRVRLRLADDAGVLRLDVRGRGHGDAVSLTARCRLEPVPPAATRVRYHLQVELGGLGGWLGSGAARRAVEEFFAALAADLSGGPRR